MRRPEGVEVVEGRQGEAGILADVEDGLYQALAEGGLTDDEGAIMVLQGSGDDLSCGCGICG